MLKTRSRSRQEEPAVKTKRAVLTKTPEWMTRRSPETPTKPWETTEPSDQQSKRPGRPHAPRSDTPTHHASITQCYITKN